MRRVSITCASMHMKACHTNGFACAPPPPRNDSDAWVPGARRPRPSRCELGRELGLSFHGLAGHAWPRVPVMRPGGKAEARAQPGRIASGLWCSVRVLRWEHGSAL